MAESSDNEELQKQYQEILNQYAEALSKSSPPPPPSPTLPVRSPDSIGTKEGPPAATSTFIKILFYFSLLIFLAVIAAVANSFIKNQRTPATSSPTPIPTETQPAVICELNEMTYQVNESFPAADGCNTCACQSDQLIICTQIACTTPTKVTPTKTSTSSAIPKNWKTYTNTAFGFSISYPAELTITDTLPAEYTKISSTKQFLLIDNKSKNISFTLMINPDGFGPIFSNKSVDVSYQSGKGLVAVNKTVVTPDENYDKTRDVSVYVGEIKTGYNIWILTQSPKDNATNEKIFSQILSTFKFL